MGIKAALLNMILDVRIEMKGDKMRFYEDPKRSFANVAMAFILVGAAILSYGMVAWIYNVVLEANLIAFPSIKIIGGLVIMALGYIQLEIELLRKK